MAFSLKNKTVLITGSTSGLGKHLALELAKLGSRIIVHGRSEEKCKEVVEELKSISKISHEYFVCDFNFPSEIEKKFNIKQLDVLINNAGVWMEGNTVDISPNRILEVINTNLTSLLIITRLCLPILTKAKFGQILNVSSIGGVEIPSGYFHTIYTSSKFGVQGFTEALAKEFDNKNLRVMGYYPGGMETKFFKKAGIDYEKHEPWMFDAKESVEAITFMLTRDPKVNVKRMDLINHLLK
jgi:short-subunit dehydrogenase